MIKPICKNILLEKRYFKSIPKTNPFDSFTTSEQLFKPDRLGSWIERAVVGTGMIFKGIKEGGFFIVIAQKPKDNTLAS